MDNMRAYKLVEDDFNNAEGFVHCMLEGMFDRGWYIWRGFALNNRTSQLYWRHLG